MHSGACPEFGDTIPQFCPKFGDNMFFSVFKNLVMIMEYINFAI